MFEVGVAGYVTAKSVSVTVAVSQFNVLVDAGIVNPGFVNVIDASTAIVTADVVM